MVLEVRDIRIKVPARYTFSHVLTLIYENNYTTADKTKHMFHALQILCGNVN